MLAFQLQNINWQREEYSLSHNVGEYQLVRRVFPDHLFYSRITSHSSSGILHHESVHKIQAGEFRLKKYILILISENYFFSYECRPNRRNMKYQILSSEEIIPITSFEDHSVLISLKLGTGPETTLDI